MKGFLIKDLRLLLQRRKLIVLYILMALAMSCTMDYHFAIYYFSMLALIMAYSTLSYDSYDNGMEFLMTMPDARKNYVKEKYLFFALVLVASWAISYLINGIVAIVQYKSIWAAAHVLEQSTLILPIFLIFCSVTIPAMLKYGAEKGRIVLALFFGIVAVIFFGIRMIEPLEHFCMEVVSAVLWRTGLEGGYICFTAVIIAGFVISFMMSNRIMQKKEF